MSTQSTITVIVLAAGGGTRMKSKTMKVLHPIAGRSMIGHVLSAVAAVEPHRVVAVVGNQREQVGPHIEELLPGAVLAVQETQDGTGHAVRVAWEALDPADRVGTVLVAYGDTPLLEGESLRAFAEDHVERGARREHPLRRRGGPVRLRPRAPRRGRLRRPAIVEQKDATPEEAAVSEINSGILAFDADVPRRGAAAADQRQRQRRVLPHRHRRARARGRPGRSGAFPIDDVLQTEGANDRVQLAALAKEKNRRILTRWMRDGVTIIDPATTWIDVDVRLGPGRDDPAGGAAPRRDRRRGGRRRSGRTRTLKDVEVGAGARVVRTHGELAVIGAGANVGPFSYLRPGTELGAGGKIGAFVETKNAQIGDGAKVPHLSYVGDAEIGEGTNIGAGTIFANYDGVAKHRTVVGRHATHGQQQHLRRPRAHRRRCRHRRRQRGPGDVPPGALAVSAGPAAHDRGLGGPEARGHAAGPTPPRQPERRRADPMFVRTRRRG